MKRKNAIMASEIFTYILMMLVVSLILIFGYKGINYLKKGSDDVVKYDLINSIQSTMKETSSYGSVREETFEVPKGVAEVCFIGWNEVPPLDFDASKYPVISFEWNAEWGVQIPTKNFFLYKEPDDSEGFFLGEKDKKRSYFNVAGKWKCIKTINNAVKIKMEGRGDKVEIT